MIKVYSSPFCVYCNMLKEFLKKHNIKFQEIDVSKDRKSAMEMVQKTGQNGVPVIEINNKFIIGFNEQKLRKELKL